MKPHEQRVVEEKAELDVRLEKLRAFLAAQSSPATAEERTRLVRQEGVMAEYSYILAERINAFGGA